ncbi:MAG: hypothetical protein M0P52_13750 [Rhodoferax sp.]|nr:hypothetical protein [Rhodoferax sp.]
MDVGNVLGQGVGVDDVGGLDAMQDHVHDRNHIGQALFLFAVKGASLQRVLVGGGQARLLAEVVKGFAQKARRAASAIVNALADPGGHDLDHGANQWAGRVVFAAVAPGIAHVLDLGFIQVRQLVFFGLRPEAQFVHPLDHVAQVVAALDAVFDLAKDFANFVFDGLRPAGALLEAVQEDCSV